MNAARRRGGRAQGGSKQDVVFKGTHGPVTKTLLALVGSSLALVGSSLALVAVVTLPTVARAENVQVNWQPNKFKVHCERSVDCHSPELRQKVVDALQEGLAALRAMGFNPPKDFGERLDAGKSTDHIRVYHRSAKGLAYSKPKCSSSNPPLSTINVGQDIKEWQSQLHLLRYFLTHEIFHIIQYGYAAWPSCVGFPGWIGEGTADAVSLDIVRRNSNFKNMFPGKDERSASKFAGLRAYNKPLNTTFAKRTGEPMQYFTSSFWRHLAEAYHGGKYKYLHKYFLIKPDGDDYLGWLSRRMLVDDGITTALPLVYAGFLADFAGWGDADMPGEFFKRGGWLARAFGGCYPLEISPTSPEAVITPALLPTSGQCVTLKVTGLSATDSVTVKVGAIFGTPSKPGDASQTDQLHLSVAASTDKKDFHCARWIRGRGPAGISGKMALGRCVFVPDTGDVLIGGNTYPGRIWNSFAQQAGSSGTFESIYILSRAAVNPSDDLPAKTSRVTATYRFLLDRGQLTDGGKDVAANKSTRVVPLLNMSAAASAQESVPMFDSTGAPAISYTNPAAIRPNLYSAAGAMAATAPAIDAVSSIGVSEVEAEEAPTKASKVSFTAMPVEKDGRGWKPRPIKLGETGSMRAGILGGSGSEMWSSIEPGTLVVEEFSTFMLRARFAGTVCNVLKATPKNKCPDAKQVSGTVVKAFAGLVLPQNRFTVYDTPSTAQYRATKEQGLAAAFGGTGPFAGPNGPESGPSSPMGGGSGGGGNLKNSCDCSCAAFDKLLVLSKSMKKGARPDPKTVQAIQKMAVCAQSCVEEYSACKRTQ